jgi:TolB-like protein/class 3 adenylate cyclase/tetratricopeptide (TPR) repeat protein
MTEVEARRRLLVILAADAVGYSRLMAADELGTIARLQAARALFTTVVQAHLGRIHDMVGDSVLAVFEAAGDAVRAAMQIQAELEGGAAAGDPARLRFRIGVHLSDAIENPGGAVYGSGVNVASRIEGAAAPGGITISASVFHALGDALAGEFEDAGEHALKNLPRPVRVFRRRAAGEASGAAHGRDATTGTGAAQAAAAPPQSPVAPGGFTDRPAIAVLPFDNLSNDPEQGYFADGIAEDILTRLAMWGYFPVIARNSSFALRGRAIDIKQAGAMLGARYVLEGSVRKIGNRVRITGQLIDAHTGHHVWADRYDRVLEDVFEVQDEMTESIVGALEPAVGRAEMERARLRPPSNLQAWDLLQKGAWHLNRLTRADMAEAEKLFAQAMERDPDFSLPYSFSAVVKVISALFTWMRPADALPAAMALARRALQSDPRDAFAHNIIGMGSAMAGQHDAGLASATKAIEINPSFAMGYYGLGFVRFLCGAHESAEAALRTAIRLSPNEPMLHVWLATLSAIRFMRNEFESACEVAWQAIQLAPHYPMGYRSLANALARLGRREQAQEALDTFLRLAPGYDLATARATVRFANAQDFEDYMSGLAMLDWRS